MGISIWELIILVIVALVAIRWFLKPAHRAGSDRHGPGWGHYAGRAAIAGCVLLALLSVPVLFLRVAYSPMSATTEMRHGAGPVSAASAPKPPAESEPEVAGADPVLSLKPVPLPEPPVMLRPSVVVSAPPKSPDELPVVAVTSQWWADREQACRQASTQLLAELVALRTDEEQRFLADPSHLQAVATQLNWSGEVEATEKDFGNGLKATMYRVHLRVPSQEAFVEHLGVTMRANSDKVRLIAAGAVFFDLTVLFGILGWLFNRKKRRVVASVAV